MERDKIQILRAESTFIPTDTAAWDSCVLKHLHINRKSIEFTKVGGIDSFGEYNMGVVPHTITGGDYGSNTIGGLGTCSCAPVRASVGVDTGVPAVNQWLKDYQASIKQSYRRTE